jgi:Pectate lyase superfamily protein
MMKTTYALMIFAGACLGTYSLLNANFQQTVLKQYKVHHSFTNEAAIALPLIRNQGNTENIIFPNDGGVINVKNAPYFAKGDGITDDTAAIQRALSDFPNQNKIIYLPNGVYLVSDQLKWPDGRDGNSYKRTILQGQSTDKTTIKLKDKAKGFTNVSKAKAVIWTGNRPAQRFRNAIRNLTLNTGNGNEDAIGIQFNASNQGGIRNVDIKSGDGQGAIGLDLTYTDEIGPCLIKNLQVNGFKRGIFTGFTVNSQTFENITLQNQKEYGFYNGGQVINIRNLVSLNSVPAVYNNKGLITILDSKLSGVGVASTEEAIINNSSLFARNITTSGYRVSIDNNSGNRQNVASGFVKEFVSHNITSLFATPLKTLNLPIRDTPEVPWGDLSQWVSPTHYGAKPNDKSDDTAAIQAAIDSGKSTLYFPNGRYTINRPVFIRGNIKRIIGLEAGISGKGAFNFIEGSSPTVVIERFDGFGSGIVHAASRTLVLSSMALADTKSKASYSNTGTGDLYIEDVVGGPWIFNNQKVWARQLNPENPGTKIVNNQGTLWVLGIKTEREGIVVDTKERGKTEIAGGLIYSTSVAKTTPMFANHNSPVSLTVSECNYNRNPFKTLISDTRGSATRYLSRGNTPISNCNGSLIHLYVGNE